MFSGPVIRLIKHLNSKPAIITLSRSYSSAQSEPSDKLTLTIEKDGIRNIILNNPKTRNALSLEMMKQLLKDIQRNQDDENLRCIVLSGNGPVFSGGHNLKELTSASGNDFHKIVFGKCSELMMALLKSPVPIIAKVNGLAAAAGCQLVAGCDMVVCTDSSSFSTPGANFGIFCSTPGIPIVRTMPKMKASYMLFTGLPITAQEAYVAGLVSRVVPVDQLDAEVDHVCSAVKSKSRAVIKLGKRFFYEQVSMNIQVAYKFGEQVMVDNLAMDDGQEGVKSFIEKRKPVWTHSSQNEQ